MKYYLSALLVLLKLGDTLCIKMVVDGPSYPVLLLKLSKEEEQFLLFTSTRVNYGRPVPTSRR